ncbi:MAG: BMP family ABC transporter substrate-binding protein [Clostridia bacterium]|nr:BMP family ABC transporter substrate-binding protein [Clostridia bacterium]
MKKILAMLLALAMLLGCAAFAETVNPDDIPDTVTSADGTYVIAFVTDVGQLKDKSFNQGTWNGVKLYAHANGLTYKYYQPANGNEATDDDRYDAMAAAAQGGAKVVVAAGFMQGTALTKAAIEFPEVNFVFIDGWPLSDAEGNVLTNVAAISFQEEQAGYLAGYAVVRDGFTKLGFSGGGGGTNAACDRYGYGFAQGANAAAAELGVNVELRYSWQYGASFSASPELQTMVAGWYQSGTEIVFACGGSMFQSIVAAAAAADAYVVGVDVDQSFESATVVTSALKGISEAAQLSIAAHFDGTWAENYGGKLNVLGANQDAVGLPTETWSMEVFTLAEYEALMNALKEGTLVVDATDYQGDAITTVAFSNLTIIYE